MQDASGEGAQEALASVLQRWGDQLSSSKGRSELHNPLSMGEALPLLPLSRPLFAGEQRPRVHSSCMRNAFSACADNRETICVHLVLSRGTLTAAETL